MVFYISHLAGTKLDAHLGCMELILCCSMSLSWLGKLSIYRWHRMEVYGGIKYDPFFSGMSIVLLAMTIAEKDL